MILVDAMDADDDFQVDFHDYETSDSEILSMDKDDIEKSYIWNSISLSVCDYTYFISCCFSFWLSKSCEECRSRSKPRLARPRSRSRF